MSNTVLDASAILAYLHNESGAELVESTLVEGAYISAANWAEVLSKISDIGGDPDLLTTQLIKQGILGSAIKILPLTEQDASAIGQLRPLTKKFGLSLADRACLALGLRLNLPVVTADQSWLKLKLGVTVKCFR